MFSASDDIMRRVYLKLAVNSTSNTVLKENGMEAEWTE